VSCDAHAGGKVSICFIVVIVIFITHTSSSLCMDRVINGICDCTLKEKDLSYQHQTWYVRDLWQDLNMH